MSVEVKVLSKLPWKHIGLFVAGAAASTVGVDVIKTEKVRDCAVKATAGVLYVKDEVMKAVTSVQENANDIYADAKVVKDDTIAVKMDEMKLECAKKEAEEAQAKYEALLAAQAAAKEAKEAAPVEE